MVRQKVGSRRCSRYISAPPGSLAIAEMWIPLRTSWHDCCRPSTHWHWGSQSMCTSPLNMSPPAGLGPRSDTAGALRPHNRFLGRSSNGPCCRRIARASHTCSGCSAGRTPARLCRHSRRSCCPSCRCFRPRRGEHCSAPKSATRASTRCRQRQWALRWARSGHSTRPSGYKSHRWCSPTTAPPGGAGTIFSFRSTCSRRTQPPSLESCRRRDWRRLPCCPAAADTESWPTGWRPGRPGRSPCSCTAPRCSPRSPSPGSSRCSRQNQQSR